MVLAVSKWKKLLFGLKINQIDLIHKNYSKQRHENCRELWKGFLQNVLGQVRMKKLLEEYKTYQKQTVPKQKLQQFTRWQRNHVHTPQQAPKKGKYIDTPESETDRNAIENSGRIITNDTMQPIRKMMRRLSDQSSDFSPSPKRSKSPKRTQSPRKSPCQQNNHFTPPHSTGRSKQKNNAVQNHKWKEMASKEVLNRQQESLNNANIRYRKAKDNFTRIINEVQHNELVNNLQQEKEALKQKHEESQAPDVDIESICYDLSFGDFIQDHTSFVMNQYIKPATHALANYSETDMRIYVNEPMVQNMITDILVDVSFPMSPNVVTDKMIEDIVGNPDFAEEIQMYGEQDISKLSNVKAIDITLYVNDRFVGDMIDQLFESADFPLIPNVVTQKAVDEISKSDFTSEIIDLFSDLDTSHLQSYNINQKKIIVDEDILDKQYEDIITNALQDLPVISNTPDPCTIEEIADSYYPELLPIFAQQDPSKLRNLDKIDLQVFVNDRNTNDKVNGILNDIIYPIVPNTFDDDVVDEILNEDFEDAMDYFPDSNADKLLSLPRIDLTLFAGDRKIDEMVSNVFSDIEYPIELNLPKENQIKEIAQFDYSDVIPPFSVLDPSKVVDLPRKDITIYVNDKIVDKISTDLWGDVKYPLIPNVPTDKAISDIVNNDYIDILFETTNFDFVHLMTIGSIDLQLYVNDRRAYDILDSYFDVLDLPIEPNNIDDETIEEILDTDPVEDALDEFAEFDIEKLLNINPAERRIDFNFPVDADSLLSSILDEIPIIPNEPTSFELSQILHDQIDFSINDIKHQTTGCLKRYEAPPEVFVLIDDVVDQLIYKLLRKHVLPYMPLKPQVYVPDDTADSIIEEETRKIDEPLTTIAQPKLNHLKDFRIVPLPIREKDTEIYAEEVMNNILWNEILPTLPVY